MLHRPSRLLLLGCLLGIIAGASLPTAALARVAVGVSDNGPYVFTDSKFQRLHIHTARDIVPWDVATTRSNRNLLGRTRTWIQFARSDGVAPLISFGGDGNYVPSTAQYASAVHRFMRDFPSVRNYTPWNEPDWIYRSLSRNPRLAASYYNALVKLCAHCTVAAGDVYLPGPQLGPWLRAYAAGLHHRPAAWALHPYDDVRSHTTGQLRTLMRYTSGPVWLDEIGGVERRGHWPFPNQSPGAANQDERFLFSLPKRYHRISRIYHYQWFSAAIAPWDSGLIAANGRPRPAYFTFAAAVRGRLV